MILVKIFKSYSKIFDGKVSDFFRFLKNFKKWALFIVNRIFDIQTINVNVESIELNFYTLWQMSNQLQIVTNLLFYALLHEL